MAFSWIMRSAAVVSLFFGLALLFAPNALLAVYKAEAMNSPGIYNSMLYGGALIAFAVMNWTASSGTAAEARHVVLANFVAMTIGFAVALFRQLTDPSVPAAGWLNVFIFLAFGILFGYLQFRRSPASGSTAARAG